MPEAVRVVSDPLEGRLLLVAGNCPHVSRVVTVEGLRRYMTEDVEQEKAEGVLWPGFIPDDMLIYSHLSMVRVAELLPVDVLAVLAGDHRLHAAGYYFWQAAVDPPLAKLTEAELRGALASRWVRALRGEVRSRGIRLR
jgi:hypothetical protein